ncbi:hypothetical protein ACFPIF_18995 [Brevundimonas faecalis]|uniref:hypothetical protein n=1 Tax=Brevundimonas faecalis TaxID=947378 RepID=UPI00361CBF3A
MTSEKPDLSPIAAPHASSRKATWLAALGFGLVYALTIYAWTRIQAPDSGMLLIGFLLGAPVMACIISVYVSDPMGAKGAGAHLGVSALTVTVMLVAAGVVLREGSVCLVMAAPIFYGSGLIAGLIAGQVMKARAGRVLCLGLLALPLIGVPIEADRPPEPRRAR